MKGVGSYNDWGYYAPPPSYNNWGYSSDVSSDSAYASSVPPIHYGYGYGFYPNPVGELDSSTQVLDSSSAQFPHSKDAFSYDPFSNGSKPSLAEAPPYYPSYVSSTIHDPISHWSSSSGFPSLGDYAKNESSELGFPGQSAALWNHCDEFNIGNGKLEGAASSFSSLQANVSGSVVEESMNQGCHDGKDSEVSQTNNSDKYNTPIVKDLIDDNSCWWGTIKPMQSSPMSLENHHKAFFKSVADPGNHHLSVTSVKQSPPASLEDHKATLKSFTDSGNHHSSGKSVMQSSPMSLEKYLESSGASVKQFPPISPEDHQKDHYKAALKLFADSGNHHSSGTSVKQSPPITPEDRHRDHIKATFKLFAESGTSVKHAPRITLEDRQKAALNFFVGSSNHHLSHAGSYDKHSKIDEPSSSNNGMIANKNVTRDVVNYVFKAGLGFQNPHASVDNLNLSVGANEDPNSVENSFEGGNRRNPAIDSPCWKRAPAACFSKHISPNPLPPEDVHKNEECFGFIVQEPQNLLDTENFVKKSCEDSKSYQVHSETVPHETISAGSPNKFSVPKFASDDCKPDVAVNAGSFQSELGFGKRLQFLDDSTDMKENGVPVTPTKPIDCKSGSFHTEHQVLGENKLMSQKQHSSSMGSADAGCNVNNRLDICHTTPEKLAGKVSTQTLNVQILVNTVQNLSELLLYNCFYNAYELEERDCNVLKSAISNLSTCVSKNDKQTAPAQECLSQQSSNASCAGDLCDLQLNASSKRSQSIKMGPESSKVHLENSLAQEANLHVKSAKQHLKISDSVCPSGDTEMAKADNMTKALKKILSENFHDVEGADAETVLYKNLWLEAEAALCSVNYRARYNQMKIEMEKHSYKQRDMEEQSKSEAVPTLSKSHSPAAEASNYFKFGVGIPNLNSLAQDLPLSAATDLNEPSDLKFSTDMNKPNSLMPEDMEEQSKSEAVPNLSKSQSPAAKTSSYFKFGVGIPNLNSPAQDLPVSAATDLNEPSDLKFSTDMNKPNALTPEGKLIETTLESFIQNYYAASGINKEAGNNDTSVMARYHVLKARLDKNMEVPSDTANKLAPGGNDNQNLVTFSQDSPIPGKNKSDYETSVVTRFHILKSRIEDSSSIYSEGKLLDEVESDDAKNASEGESLDFLVNPAAMDLNSDLNSYTAVDKSIPKDFHLDLEDSHPTGIQLRTCYSDGLASDWEHVE